MGKSWIFHTTIIVYIVTMFRNPTTQLWCKHKYIVPSPQLVCCWLVSLCGTWLMISFQEGGVNL